MSNIKGLLNEEMPREKLINFGPESLTQIELLAILLRVGTKNKNVIELSREILNKFNINQVSRKTYSELLEFKGIKKAKATQIVALFEFSRRLQFEKYKSNIKVKIKSSKDVYENVFFDFSNLTIEKVMLILVDSKNQIIKKEFIHEGSINYSIIEPRNIIKKILSYDAYGFFLIHNHPSGDITPSQEDKNITKKIKEICDKLNISFLDHLIIGDNYYSFFDNSLI